jgi:hypothetical protein
MQISPLEAPHYLHPLVVLPVLVLLVGQLLYVPLTFTQILLRVSKSAAM